MREGIRQVEREREVERVKLIKGRERARKDGRTRERKTGRL